MVKLARLAALLCLVALPACKPEATAEIGMAAPDLAALTLDGQSVDLETLKGKIVFVNFWWSGCGPCLAEMPEIEEVYRDRGPDDFVVLAINIGQEAEDIEAARRRTEVTYPLLMDRLKIDAQKYGVIAAPTSFLIGRDGVLIERVLGPVTREELDARVAALS